MKMESGPGYIDMGEEITWIAAESRKLGEPIPVDVVRKVLCLEVEFQLLTGNAAIDDPQSDEPSILCAGDEGDAIREDSICPWCMSESGTTPPDEGGSGNTRE